MKERGQVSRRRGGDKVKSVALSHTPVCRGGEGGRSERIRAPLLRGGETGQTEISDCC